MKKLFRSTVSILLGSTLLFLSSPIFAEEPIKKFIPLSIEAGGTSESSVSKIKEKLEIPEVVDSTDGDSTTNTMSQRAIKEAIAAGSGGGIIVTQDSSSLDPELVMSAKAVKEAIQDSIGSEIQIEQNLGNYIDRTVSQNAIKEAIDAVQTQINERPTTVSVNSSINTAIQNNISQTTGQDPTKSISQKAFSEAILTPQMVFNMIYPVGSIYISVEPANPGTLFGGNWTAWGSGCVPVGINVGDFDFNTAGKTGGSKTVALTETQIPAHQHSIYAEYGTSTNLSYNPTSQNYMQLAGTNAWTRSVQSSPVVNGGGSGTTTGVGHNNLQPYIVCYMWKRIS